MHDMKTYLDQIKLKVMLSVELTLTLSNVTVTHHRVAGLENLTEQDGTLTLCKRLSERTEAAGVSDIWAVHTLDTHTHRVVLDYTLFL